MRKPDNYNPLPAGIKRQLPPSAPPRVSQVLDEKVSDAVEDVCQFHRYGEQISKIAFEITLPRTMRTEAYFLRRISDMKVLSGQLYEKMQAISKKYPQNNSLKNKLDEAERYIWPHGRR